MTSPAADRAYDQAAHLFAQGQQAIADAVGAASQSWADVLRRLSPAHGAPGLAAVPVVPVEVVDRFFDTGVAVLEAQRTVVHSTMDALRAMTPVADGPGRPRR